MVTAPAMADLDNAETGHARPQVHVRPPPPSTASTALGCSTRSATSPPTAYGGWKPVTNIQAGGGLYAQRIVTRKHYDLQAARRRAQALADLPDLP